MACGSVCYEGREGKEAAECRRAKKARYSGGRCPRQVMRVCGHDVPLISFSYLSSQTGKTKAPAGR